MYTSANIYRWIYEVVIPNNIRPTLASKTSQTKYPCMHTVSRDVGHLLNNILNRHLHEYI